ncbi:MAG: hypothetical protein QM652_10325 [Legionella sp.]|uniref:hypothetical protein n=1 Tax=Legionella sp. TaxID=459 RepID=UPI0039E61883
MHISLLLDRDSRLELRIGTDRHFNNPAWVVDWVKKNIPEKRNFGNFDSVNGYVVMTEKEEIQSFIAVYEKNGKEFTEYGSLFSIFSPQHLKDVFNEILLQTDLSKPIELSIFENAYAKYPVSSYLSSSECDEELKQVMVVAPIENIELNTQIKNYQSIIANEFHLHDEVETFFHISFAVPLTVTTSELRTLKQKLHEISIPAIEIKPKRIRTFENGTIYLEVDDINNQLEQLNKKIILTIHEAGIHCNIRFKEYIPHITLFLMPAVKLGQELELKSLEKESYYLTKVILSESQTNKGITNYVNVMSLPNDFFLKSKSLEEDFFDKYSKGIYLNDEFNNHPLSDYYQMLAKLSTYLEKPDQVLVNQITHLYRKILGYSDERYATDPETTAVLMYTRGLIFQYGDRLYPIIKHENATAQMQALSFFKRAEELGYIDARKNIGIVNYELGHLSEAKKFLEKAICFGPVNSYVKQYYDQCKEDIRAEVKHKTEKNHCRIM